MSMEISGVQSYQATYQKTETKKTSETSVEVKTDETKAKNEDSYTKTQEEPKVTYKMDADKVREMKAALKNQEGVLQSMVQGMFGKQLDLSQNVGKQLQDLMASKADGTSTGTGLYTSPEDFFNDPVWGVEAVATRIVDFAKALSGGDPGMIGLLKDATIKGFGAAEKAWGSKMPDISGKTYDRVMELFDEWENPKETEEAEEAAPSEAEKAE